MDLQEWLERLGLPQYAESLLSEGVDLTVVGVLSDQDLRDLGVSLLGHRRKIMAAAGSISPADVSGAAPTPLPKMLSQGRQNAERRPITVLFCDLVGSTSLAANLDAEDWREIVGNYLEMTAAAVVQFEGYVLKHLGDGLMALFGFPKAQENDAERAVRAALAMLRAIEDANARNAAQGRPVLAARIGLDSGPVVVDATGEVFGEAPNVAARVQNVAEPGTLLVTTAVQRQVAGLFLAEDKGSHVLKGVADKVTLFRIVSASGGRRRQSARILTPLVGRDEELAALTRRWERARNGEGQFLHIVGDPGLGKSRLIEEFRLRLGETPHTWTEWTASQLLQNTPLHPVAEWGKQRFASEHKLDDLIAALEQLHLDSAEYAPLLAPLIGVEVAQDRHAHLSGDERRRKQFSAMQAWLFAAARAQPVVLVVEDMQWADPTTLELMKALCERGAEAPLMILATSRPDFRPSWPTLSHHGVMALAPLDRTQIREMVSALAARSVLSNDIVETLAERTAGVPLFVEELTRVMLEGNVHTIPPTLQQSLAARLDRLGGARELAQIGAVLGREFSHALIGAVAGMQTPVLDLALKQLTDAELLLVEGTAPDCAYRFKHALIRDAAYESLLKGRRQALHRRTAEALVLSPDPQPELVAYHFAQSAQFRPAVEWWSKAGDAALKRGAYAEAISHLGKATEIIDAENRKAAAGAGLSAQGPDSAWATLETTIRLNYARALMLSDGFASEPSREASMRALRSAESTSSARRFEASYIAWITHFIGADMVTARELADAFVTDAKAEGLATERAVGLRMAGTTCLFQGEFVEAKTSLQAALGVGARVSETRDRFRFFDDHEASAKITLAAAEWFLGNIESAHRLADDALEIADVLRHAPTLCAVRSYRGMLWVREGRPGAAELEAAELQAMGAEHGMPVYLALARLILAWAQGQRKPEIANVSQLRSALDDLNAANHRHVAPFVNLLLAEAELATGDPASALVTTNAALELIAESGIARESVDALRLRGDILARLDSAPPEDVARCYRAAVDTARRQCARTPGLRAALSFGRFLQEGGKRAQAVEVLSSALEGFENASELPVAMQARQLLKR